MNWADDNDVSIAITKQLFTCLRAEMERTPDVCTRYLAGNVVLLLHRDGLDVYARDVDVSAILDQGSQGGGDR